MYFLFKSHFKFSLIQFINFYFVLIQIFLKFNLFIFNINQIIIFNLNLILFKNFKINFIKIHFFIVNRQFSFLKLYYISKLILILELIKFFHLLKFIINLSRL